MIYLLMGSCLTFQWYSIVCYVW